MIKNDGFFRGYFHRFTPSLRELPLGLAWQSTPYPSLRSPLGLWQSIFSLDSIESLESFKDSADSAESLESLCNSALDSVCDSAFSTLSLRRDSAKFLKSLVAFSVRGEGA